MRYSDVPLPSSSSSPAPLAGPAARAIHPRRRRCRRSTTSPACSRWSRAGRGRRAGDARRRRTRRASRWRRARSTIGRRFGVIYPADRIRYALGKGDALDPAPGAGGRHVRRLATMGRRRRHDHDRSHEGRRVTIAHRSGGLDAHADLRSGSRRAAASRSISRSDKVTVTNVNGDLWIDASSAPVTATGFKGC